MDLSIQSPKKTAMDPADADSVCWLPRAVWTEEEETGIGLQPAF